MKRTAITRKKPSLRTRWLVKNDLIKGRVLDYGCGRGKDAETLKCEKYDPSWSPKLPKGKFDTIICVYVLNVVLEKMEKKILKDIKNRLKKGGKAYFAVRRDNFVRGFNNISFQRWSTPELDSINKTSSYEIYIMKKE